MKVAVIGHRKIDVSHNICNKVGDIIENLIVSQNADTFIFGGRGMFDELCYDVVTRLQKKYQNIKRVYLRSQFEFIGKQYKEYLLESYEVTEFPQTVHNAGRLSHVKRNEAMIDMSDVLIVFYDKEYKPNCRNGNITKSGTGIALDYAKRKGKKIINVFEANNLN